MDPALNPAEPRERAVSSEPCSTRPNPFNEGEISSRKRRRTSLRDASRSRSADTVDSLQPSSPSARSLHVGIHEDMTMKIDTDPTTPHTPETKPFDSPSPLEPRSSRVTINVRTPARPLEVIPSSPLLPTIVATDAAALSDEQVVKLSVEAVEENMSPKVSSVDTTETSPSIVSSPPVEIIDVQADSDSDTGMGPPVVTLMQPTGDKMYEHLEDYPYRDRRENHYEQYTDSLQRTINFFTSYDSVPRELALWVERCVELLRVYEPSAARSMICETRDFWLSFPELVWGVIHNKIPWPRSKAFRDNAFEFHKQFARLTAYFAWFDVTHLRHMSEGDDPSAAEFMSPTYVRALALLTKGDDIVLQEAQSSHADDEWDHAAEVSQILKNFQDFQMAAVTPGGTLAYLKRLVKGQIEQVPWPAKFSDDLGNISLLASNILRESAQSVRGPCPDRSLSEIACGYRLFTTLSAALSDMMERHLNSLSLGAAIHLIPSMAEVYTICLSTENVVPLDLMEEQLQGQPPILPHHRADAVAHLWKFGVCAKLIMSNQMQLRIMAVSTMAQDLVGLWSRYGADRSNQHDFGLLRCMAGYLLRSGLVAYLFSPSCHPEVMSVSSNIIGFLIVSKTYTSHHTDALWQTFDATQNPQVSEALIKMVHPIVRLMELDALYYLCEKLNTVPAGAFTVVLRQFFQMILQALLEKERSLEPAPFDLCIRLIKESSVFGSHSATAHPELLEFAMKRYQEVSSGISSETLENIYRVCIQDIAAKSRTTLGSLWILWHTVYKRAGELPRLFKKFDLTELLVAELEAAIPAARRAGFPAVLSGLQNKPRNHLIKEMIVLDPFTISSTKLGPRLWDLLVGNGAASQEDRDAAWCILNSALDRTAGDSALSTAENPFVFACFAEYLPALSPACFCSGALDFVKKRVLSRVNDPNNILLDNDESIEAAGIEQLWRIILEAPPQTVEQKAIYTLVVDVYIESRSILSFPHYRARKVHLKLVKRCLGQMSQAVTQLKSYNDGTSGGDDEPMVTAATDEQVRDQNLLFIRSLSVLREFHQAHQAKAHFCAPDMRLLMSDLPWSVEGESAELKVQSFDGGEETTVLPLEVGKKNTLSTLLAILRDATGFENYRIYYRGKPFIPQQRDVHRSLEELHICNNILLVKKEPEMPPSPTTSRIRPGASPVEVEILSHFEELWEYLTLEENLAREIYRFLVRLPADEKVLAAIGDSATPYKTLFPLGQPFKSLYAVHVLNEYLVLQRRLFAPVQLEPDQDTLDAPPDPVAAAFQRTLSVVVAAISDPDVVSQDSGSEVQIELSFALLERFVHIVADPLLPSVSWPLLDGHLLDRLLPLLAAMPKSADKQTVDHVVSTLKGLFVSCNRSALFWSSFCTHPHVPDLLENFLLNDRRIHVRQMTAHMILEQFKKFPSGSTPSLTNPQAFFWPLLMGWIEPALFRHGTGAEALHVCNEALKTLREWNDPILDVPALIRKWIGLLSQYKTFEDPTKPDIVDQVAHRFLQLVQSLFCDNLNSIPEEWLPEKSMVGELFWRHLYPPFVELDEETESSRPICCPDSRAMLVDILFCLIGKGSSQAHALVQELGSLVPCFRDDGDGDIYAYDLPAQFDRARAIRAPCGYAGLKNLSNTCYFNSLLTQLFMNVGFRQFMVSAATRSMDLLHHTQILFSNMQETLRRSVNTEFTVASIKTYEESQIDIHNQMDVDEFYNLLFDRWEAQIVSAEAKKRFRSFYGGQLVQQVKSKECPHVSERTEPFSAIQCDIKGKANLEESLQAYVDGEIMEGENKYKCSTCDEHVDAVKRACLKDIPDNLIFHLKRFDFSLQTLQRSKINDYFTFSTTLDMTPYTIEYLSDPDEEMPQDLFELVGVLIHSGTAESGHYYSYVRERPSSNETPTWVEFNDDVVTQWDPAHLESACFGGPEYRSPYEGGNIYEKTYSAYMLFYQRASSLTRDQHRLRQSGKTSPLHVALPPDVLRHIQRENLSILRQHCLFDPGQIPLVLRAMDHLAATASTNKCSRDHVQERDAMNMALAHLDQVAARVKDANSYFALHQKLLLRLRECVDCAFCCYDYFRQWPGVLRFLVQRNPNPHIRETSAGLLIDALHCIKNKCPFRYGLPGGESLSPSMDLPADDENDNDDRFVLDGMVVILGHLWRCIHTTVRSWHEVFGLMCAFAKMGRTEIGKCLEADFVENIVLTILAGCGLSIELHPPFNRLASLLSRRTSNRAVDYGAVISLLGLLLSAIPITGAQPPFALKKGAERWLMMEMPKNRSNAFLERLISINQSEAETDAIIANLLRLDVTWEEPLFLTLRACITGQSGAANWCTPFLRVAEAVFCRFATRPELVEKLIEHICQACSNLQGEGRAFWDFHRRIFDAPRENTGESEEEILVSSVHDLPYWAPGLLGYCDTEISEEVAKFLDVKLFDYGPNPDLGDSDAARTLGDTMVQTGKLLGIRCLEFLRENYVNREMEANSRYVAALEHVISRSKQYFKPTDSNDELYRIYTNLCPDVLDGLRRLIVEEVEDDGSDWENSSLCSDNIGSLGDMSVPALGDLNDGDLA